MGLISNGTTLFDAGAMAAGLAGNMVFMKKLTASDSANLTFVHGSGGVDFTTYKEYIFFFKDIHLEANANWGVQFDTGSNSNFNQTITSTAFYAYKAEASGNTTLSYNTGSDKAQATTHQVLMMDGLGTDADNSNSGFIKLYDPGSSTFVKAFSSETQVTNTNSDGTGNPYCNHCFVSGYINTTTAITKVQFTAASDNFNGDIILYAIA